MGSGLGNFRQMTAELVRALLVLALLCLNFAHTTPTVAASGSTDLLAASTLQASDFCGTPLSGGSDHVPCHACRVGAGADLPAPPDLAIPARFAAPAFPPVVPVALGVVARPGYLPPSRAPPSFSVS
jgi:hypothetical protein